MHTVTMTSGCPVRVWNHGVPMDDNTIEQAVNISKMPFVHHKGLCLMPDGHVGNGGPVGLVLPTIKAIIPATVGVDLGCGMIAAQTNLHANDLPSGLSKLREMIERAVPAGRSHHGQTGDVGAWERPPDDVQTAWNELKTRFLSIVEKHKVVEKSNTITHLGTLGGGNHFIELCLDENNAVWIMLHSGSRGVGNRIGSYFIDRAKEETARWHVQLPDKQLAFLPEGHPLFADYVEAVQWAQDFAFSNRQIMFNATLLAVETFLDRVVSVVGQVVNCHHNYVRKEHHFNENIWVTRKGAVSARAGELGIIPGSMGARSFIVAGKGDPSSYTSCSHGAGRVMTRTQARKMLTEQDLKLATEGVECRKDKSVIDEAPQNYKDIDAVMAAQADLVEIKHTLKQILCVKGADGS